MSNHVRDDGGRFAEKVTDQAILKVFDYETTVDEPYLTAGGVRDSLDEHFDVDVTTEAVRVRLGAMVDEGDVAKRRFGGGVAYRALASPRLSEAVRADLEEIGTYEEQDETVSLDEMKAEFGME